MLRPNLCDYSDAYIVVKEDIIVAKKYLLLPLLRDRIIQILMELILIMQITMRLVKKKLVLKNNAPFVNCISKINGIKIDNAEDLDVAVPIYNLLEYSKNYKKNNR